MTALSLRLEDKYELASGRVFITANQALVRLPVDQARRDRAAGLRTTGYISGYRGSPLGVYDLALWNARALLEAHDVRFVPGINEELAASALRGTQQLQWFGRSRYEGVFGLWYGKGVGVDRACEALKLGNLEGASAQGGFLALAGDDHSGKSSDSAHQSEHTLIAAFLPILYPATTRELLQFGLAGWAMSRFSGCYVGLKCVTDTLDLTATVELPRVDAPVILPDVIRPPGGLNLQANLAGLVEEDLLVNYRLPAAAAFAAANGLDCTVIEAPHRTLSIVAAGKAYLDVRQALEDLGLTEAECRRLGIRLYKPGLIWPLERTGLRRFAADSRVVLVVEEKRPVMEEQIASLLYALASASRPALAGKRDLSGGPLLPSNGELTPGHVRRAIGRLCAQIGVHDERLQRALADFDALESRAHDAGSARTRPPFFCSGCPHNTSTRLPEGSLALGGTGCHALVAVVMDRNTLQFLPMGHEGANWTSVAPLVDTPHIFANMGDGTYAHSGILAIRAAVTAGSNITYKVLYNDAVAMTGGQPVDLPMTPMGMVQQLLSEGVKPVRLVSDAPEQFSGVPLPRDASVHHRDELDALQRELREVQGVSAIVYVQTCAAEKRRRRKRGKLPEPEQRVFIHPGVCEGCGDCSVQSNCVSVLPLETEFGRKRQIDQSNCNKDYSCLEGFCPSFVTVTGAKLAVQAPAVADTLEPHLSRLPLPALAALPLQGYNICVAGIGGTGVQTVGALIGMAAHLDGMGCSILDMTGLAQKGGAVTSHIRVNRSPDAIHTARLSEGMTDLVIACDLIVGASPTVLKTVRPGSTIAVLNTDVAPTGEFQSHKDADFSDAPLRRAVQSALGDGVTFELPATRIATRATGDSIATNVLMLGYAAQRGLLPLSIASLEQAIRLNGTFVEGNLRSFNVGRLAAHAPQAIDTLFPKDIAVPALSSLAEVLVSRSAQLTAYQDARYAARYEAFVDSTRRQLQARGVPAEPFAREVALTLAQLMAYKDEYEVARLFADPLFARRLRGQMSGRPRLTFHLAPPMLPGRDWRGRPKKRAFGSWMLTVFALLARCRSLRGTPLDPFGYTAERRLERQLIDEYRALIESVLPRMTSANEAPAIEIAAAARQIVGYGPVKHAAIDAYRQRLSGLLARFESPPVTARD